MTLKDSNQFIFVKCADKKTATEIKPGTPPEILFYDCDGELISRERVTDLSSVESAMKNALTKYSNKEIAWQDYSDNAVSAAKEAGKIVVLAYVNDKDDSVATLKAFEDRAIAKKHDKMVFLKVAYEKDSASAKKYNVNTAPTVIYIDPSKDEKTQVIEKVKGKQSVNAIRNSIAKAFAKQDSK